MDERARARQARLTTRRFASLAEADAADRAYWQSVPVEERVLQVWRLSQEQWRLLADRTDESGLCPPTMLERGESEMDDGARNEPAQLAALEEKVDKLSASVDARFARVDTCFDKVREALVEQRQYAEFAFETLRTEMTAGFSRMDRRFDRVLDSLARTNHRRRRRRS
jgi:hypothetical protein